MRRLKAIARQLKIEAHAAWLAARDPQVPLVARLFGLFVAAYALSPIDLIPDFIPVLGLLDDALLIPLGIWLFFKMVPEEVYARHRATAEGAATRPLSRVGALMIGTIWVCAVLWVVLLLRQARYY